MTKSRARTFAACRAMRLCFVLLTVVLASAVARAGIDRVVVVKVDGLPPAVVDAYVRERDPRTGKSRLPWFEHVFYERGTRLANFYVRGTSLSAPSWSLLDTGQHLQIKGNVEYDRFTLRTYDYLNFIPFYIANGFGYRVDMPGPELLDDLRIPLLQDAYPYEARYPSFQLFQRGVRWTTLQNAAVNRVTSRSPKELFDEWTTLGFDARSLIPEQLERDLFAKLRDPNRRYLDYYTTEFDHVAHGNSDRASQFHALEEIDGFIGRVWTEIKSSPLAETTALVLVSDHGINSEPGAYSQGFNLVQLLGSLEGGGHHVITKRRPMLEYAIKGIYPFVPLVTSTSEHSEYLKGQSTDYPTALLDFDGNERASVHLRDSDVNRLHILLQQLRNGKLSAPVRRAATDHFFRVIDRNRPQWRRTLVELDEELGALRREIAGRQSLAPAEKPRWTDEQLRSGVNKEFVREQAALRRMVGDEKLYTEYTRTLARLLELQSATFEPTKVKIEELIARSSMGEANSLHELENYVVGLAPRGLALDADGNLDEASFRQVNYFELIENQRVRNVVQPGLGNRPVDFVGVRVDTDAWREFAKTEKSIGDIDAEEIVLLYGGAFRSALVLGRHNARGELELRYLPIEDFAQDADGRLRLRPARWATGFPLKIWEDANFRAPGVTSMSDAGTRADATSDESLRRQRWLDAWHTDDEWLRATHKTHYSNAVVGIHEQFAVHPIAALDANAPGISVDERLMRRLRLRQRKLVEADMFIHASDRWNFDVRGFNPGGNHGSFYRISTHSSLMFAGGARTGIRHNHIIDEPYDSLSFVPTVLALGASGDASRNLTIAWREKVRALPGRVIADILDPAAPRTNVAGGDAVPISDGRKINTDR